VQLLHDQKVGSPRKSRTCTDNKSAHVLLQALRQVDNQDGSAAAIFPVPGGKPRWGKCNTK
jgi:hypothetical protein